MLQNVHLQTRVRPVVFGVGLCAGRPCKGRGDLEVVRHAQVGVEVEQGRGDVATDWALLSLASAEMDRVNMSS